MKVTAYKCEDTGTIFEQLEDYRKHRAKINRQFKKQREYNEKQTWLNEKWQEMCNLVSTLEELERWVTDNWYIFEENYYHNYYGDRRRKLPQLIEFKVITENWFDRTWKLRIRLQLSSETPSFIGLYFDNSPLVTTGGGGSHTGYNQRFKLDPEKFHTLTTRYLLSQRIT